MPRFNFSFEAMACENTITLFAPSKNAADAAAAAAIGEVQRIEAKYSRYRDDSVLSEINHRAGGGVAARIDAETSLLLAFAHSCFEQSDGLFDITSGVLRRVWNFRAHAPPSKADVARVLPLIGWKRVERTAESVYLPDKGMEIDFGGFGKEYAADRAAAVLLAHGVANGFVDLGGDVVVTGPQSGDESTSAAWSLGVRHPRIDNQLLATLSIASGAVATSGDYERFIDHDGRRYSHILNPNTGESTRGFQCVTAFAPSCLVAGSIATIAMLKDEAAGRAWLMDLAKSGVRALAVGSDGLLSHYP